MSRAYSGVTWINLIHVCICFKLRWWCPPAVWSVVEFLEISENYDCLVLYLKNYDLGKTIGLVGTLVKWFKMSVSYQNNSHRQNWRLTRKWVENSQFFCLYVSLIFCLNINHNIQINKDIKTLQLRTWNWWYPGKKWLDGIAKTKFLYLILNFLWSNHYPIQLQKSLIHHPIMILVNLTV